MHIRAAKTRPSRCGLGPRRIAASSCLVMASRSAAAMIGAALVAFRTQGVVLTALWCACLGCWPPIWAKTPINAAIRIIAIGLGTSIVFKAQSAQEATRLSEGEWREVFEHNSVMYFMVDASAAVRLVNAFGSAQLGYRADELIGQSVFQLYPDGDRERVRSNLDLCLESPGHSNTWEVQKVRKDGERLWVRETATAIKRAQGGVVVLIAGEDITERRRAEESSSGKREALSGPDRARLRCGGAVRRQYRPNLRQPFD